MNGDLISRSALLEVLRKSHSYHANTSRDVSLLSRDIRLVKEAPAVDAVEVIKCQDCFYWMKAKVNRSGNLVCPKSGMEIVATDYCSKADKRRCKYEK